MLVAEEGLLVAAPSSGMGTKGAVVAWTLALAAAAAVSAVILTSDHASQRGWTLALSVPTGLLFVASGLIARARRPDNRIGILLVAAGIASFFGGLRGADDSAVFTLGHALQWLYFGFLVHAVVAFPFGRLPRSFDRALAAAGYVLAVALLPLLMVFESGDDGGHAECARPPCPENVLAVAPDETVTAVLDAIHLWVALAFVVLILARLAHRWARAAPAQRYAASPVYACFSVLMVLVAATHVVEAAWEEALPTMNWLLLGALLTVPLSFLFGLFRSRFGTAVERLVVELSTARPGTVRDALARALGDPTLQLAYCIGPGTYVDLEGHPVTMPAAHSGRRASVITREGDVVAALVHDDSISGDPLLEPVGAAAALALENERLSADLRARLEELRASRTRLVHAADEARRRLERNLHDGAQQRLVALALAVRLARAKVRDDPEAAEELLAAAADEAGSALAELRELARGLHPAVLSERGLAPALEALAGRAPCPVEVAAVPAERLPPAVETAAYYVVSESLANVAKYARASAARVSVTRDNGRAVVEVADDGVGGADVAAGSGLRGLADRVEALDGRLRVESAPGRGTRVVAEIPCDDLAGAPAHAADTVRSGAADDVARS